MSDRFERLEGRDHQIRALAPDEMTLRVGEVALPVRCGFPSCTEAVVFELSLVAIVSRTRSVEKRLRRLACFEHGVEFALRHDRAVPPLWARSGSEGSGVGEPAVTGSAVRMDGEGASGSDAIPPGASPVPPTLEELLAFERSAPAHPAAKARAARARFGFSLVRYWREVIVAIHDPEALRVDPVRVAALRRLVADHRTRRVP